MNSRLKTETFNANDEFKTLVENMRYGMKKLFLILITILTGTSSFADDWHGLSYRGYNLQFNQIKIFFHFDQYKAHDLIPCKHKWEVTKKCDESQSKGKNIGKIDVKLSQSCGNAESFYSSVKTKKINVDLYSICQTRDLKELYVNGKLIDIKDF
jgi:hypothetical protein